MELGKPKILRRKLITIAENTKQHSIREILVSHGGEYEDGYLLRDCPDDGGSKHL
jgi:hypothetical protein